MKPNLDLNEKRNGYLVPIVEISFFDRDKDILCMSSEDKDNDYDAGGLFGSNG